MTTQEEMAIGEALGRYPGARRKLTWQWSKNWNNNPETHYFPIRELTEEEFNTFKGFGLLQGSDCFRAKLTVKGCRYCARWSS